MLPNVLPNSASDHTPVLADEVRRAARRRSPARRSSTPRSAPAATRACSPQDLAGQRQARRDRPRPERQAALRPLQGAGRGRRPLPPRRLRDRPQPARRERHQGRRDPARHRRLVDADRPARARLLVRDRRAARHAHGSRPSEMTAATIVNTWDETELATIFRRFGEERYAGPIARAIVRRRAERPFFRTGDLVDVIKTGDPDPGPVRRGASREARLPGAPDRRQRRARPARGCAARRRRDAAARWAARGDQLPLARGPDREAVHGRRARRAARARPTSRSACAARSRSCGC